MTTLEKLEVRDDGQVTRDAFEKELLRVVKGRGEGWNGTFAMVTLGIMFVARSISDVATAIQSKPSLPPRRD